MASSSRFVMCVIDSDTLVFAQKVTQKERRNVVTGRMSLDGSNRNFKFEKIAFASTKDAAAAGFGEHPFAVVDKALVDKYTSSRLHTTTTVCQ